MEISVCAVVHVCFCDIMYKALCICLYTVCVCAHFSQLIDNPQQAVPAGGSFMLQLVVVEQQQCAQHLSAANDGCHVLEGRSWPREPGHCRASDTGTENKRIKCTALRITTFICHFCVCIVVLPSIGGMSPWSFALLVKGAFCSTTANRGGMRDCRADRNTCSLCSSRPCSPCYRTQEDRSL